MDAGKMIESRIANAVGNTPAAIGFFAFVLLAVGLLSGCQLHPSDIQQQPGHQRPINELASEVLTAQAERQHAQKIAKVNRRHQQDELANRISGDSVDWQDENQIRQVGFDDVGLIPIDAPSPPISQPVDDLFIDTDVREAIQSLATQAKVSVVVDDSVAGVVTATINQEPFETALKKVLLPLGLYFRWHEGQYLICSADPDSAMFALVSQRLQYEPLHSSPQELADLLPEKDKQFVRVASSRNTMIIEAPDRLAQQIHQELTSLDQPVAQVVLEAMVVVVSPDSKFQFGMDFSHGVAGTGTGSDFNLALDGLALAGNWGGNAARHLFGRFAVTSHFIRALEQEGYVSIRATPHVMAKNGEKAEISIARETFFGTQPITSNLFIRQDIQKVEAGITLEITPSVRGDSVSMVIDRAEVSEDIRSALNDASLADPYPLINRRKVSTTVNVRDGETMVIGGLMQNQIVDRISKVPVLGGLPLVGRAFQKIERSEEAAEVVVFISPRIVHGSDFVQGFDESLDEYRLDVDSPPSVLPTDLPNKQHHVIQQSSHGRNSHMQSPQGQGNWHRSPHDPQGQKNLYNAVQEFFAPEGN